MTWRDVKSDPPPRDTAFLAGLWVRTWNGTRDGYSMDWEQYVIWIDGETDEIPVDCDPGWSIDDFTGWQPLPPPPPPPEAS